MLASPTPRPSRTWLTAIVLASLAGVVAGCGSQAPETPTGAANTPPAPATVADDTDASLPPPANETGLPEALRSVLYSPFTGDFDRMLERRLVRVGVTFNRTFYFADQGEQRGVSYELGRAFEDELNKTLKRGSPRVIVAFVPLPRDLLAKALTDGKIDLVAAQITIRPELEALVDFTNPTRTNISEVVVTGPGAPPITSVDDLSGKDVWTRKDSNFYQSLVDLNGRLKAKGKAPVVIREAPGNLEDDDLLEMVNAGLIPTVVAHDYMAAFWKKIFTNLTVHDTVTLRTGASLAVAIRKNSPKLASALNTFLEKYGLGTAFGNVVEKRYLQGTTFAKQATSEAERKKFLALVEIFKKYSEQYSVDYLLMAAQGYQESGLDHSARSRVGAIGVMQLMPATGKDMKVGDIKTLDANIHAGVKYMRFMVDQYFKDEPQVDRLNKGLLAFASYNAGPGRVRQLRKEAAKRGLDPNVWFGNVEQIASERIGRETVTYVSNIYKYYVAYRLIADERGKRDAAKASMQPGAR